MSDLEERVVQLETVVGRWRNLTLLLALIMAGVVITGAAGPDVTEVLRTRRLEIVNGAGKNTVVIDAGQPGAGGSVSVANQNGEVRARLRASRGEMGPGGFHTLDVGELGVTDHSGVVDATLSSDDSGAGFLSVCRLPSSPGAGIECRSVTPVGDQPSAASIPEAIQTHRLEVVDTRGKPQIVLEAKAEGGSMELRSPSGEARVVSRSTTTGGSVDVTDERGRSAAGLWVSNDGRGMVSVQNRKVGSVSVAMTTDESGAGFVSVGSAESGNPLVNLDATDTGGRVSVCDRRSPRACRTLTPEPSEAKSGDQPRTAPSR